MKSNYQSMKKKKKKNTYCMFSYQTTKLIFPN